MLSLSCAKPAMFEQERRMFLVHSVPPRQRPFRRSYGCCACRTIHLSRPETLLPKHYSASRPNEPRSGAARNRHLSVSALSSHNDSLTSVGNFH